jgi:hypothetical protein
MKVARIYLRVSTEEQDLSRQDAIVESTKAAGCAKRRKRPAISVESDRSAEAVEVFSGQGNQAVGLIRFCPLLDSPLRPIRWQLSRSLSQMASAAPASPMTLPHFSMGT